MLRRLQALWDPEYLLGLSMFSWGSNWGQSLCCGTHATGAFSGSVMMYSGYHRWVPEALRIPMSVRDIVCLATQTVLCRLWMRAELQTPGFPPTPLTVLGPELRFSWLYSKHFADRAISQPSLHVSIDLFIVKVLLVGKALSLPPC